METDPSILITSFSLMAERLYEITDKNWEAARNKKPLDTKELEKLDKKVEEVQQFFHSKFGSEFPMNNLDWDTWEKIHFSFKRFREGIPGFIKYSKTGRDDHFSD